MRYLFRLTMIVPLTCLFYELPGLANDKALERRRLLMTQSTLAEPFFQEVVQLEETPNRASLNEEANNLLQQGTRQYRVGQFQQTLNSFQAALKIYQEIGNRAGEAQTLGRIAFVYRSQGNYTDALDYYQQSLVVRRDVGDKKGEAQALGHNDFVYRSQDNYVDALDYYQQSLVVRRDVGAQEGDAHALGRNDLVYRSQGNFVDALDF
ncbi:MAG: tetratricopeptide repeat protein, partial [Phormidesmis sp.]